MGTEGREFESLRPDQIILPLQLSHFVRRGIYRCAVVCRNALVTFERCALETRGVLALRDFHTEQVMISVRFAGGISDKRADLFQSAAARWDRMIETRFDRVEVEGAVLTGPQIDVSISNIDGPEGVLGQAGPTVLMPGSELPIRGIMAFDEADVERLERELSLADVILHEMGHVLGFGTLWRRKGLVSGSGSNNPEFVGAAAAIEYAALLEKNDPTPVPIANTGGTGTREGHWRELVFGDELLTGFLSGAARPISRMSLGSFQDLGYAIDLNTADSYSLPTFRELAQLGVTEAVRRVDLCRMARTIPVVLGE